MHPNSCADKLPVDSREQLDFTPPGQKPAELSGVCSARPSSAAAEAMLREALAAYDRTVDALREQKQLQQLERRIAEAEFKKKKLEETPDPQFKDPQAQDTYRKKRKQAFDLARADQERAKDSLEYMRRDGFVAPERPLRCLSETAGLALRSARLEEGADAKQALAKQAGIVLEKLMEEVPSAFKGAAGEPELIRFSNLERGAASREDAVKRLQDLADHLSKKVTELDENHASRRAQRQERINREQQAVLDSPLVKKVMENAANGDPHPQTLLIFMEGGRAIRAADRAGFTLGECNEPDIVKTRLAGRNVDGVVFFSPTRVTVRGRTVADMKVSRVIGAVPKQMGTPSLREFLDSYSD